MKNDEHEIIKLVLAAKKDSVAADELIQKYLPFIKSETSKFIKRMPVEGSDDELAIAMFAFYEAAMAYQSGRGTFLSLAATSIRNRLIDYYRKEQKHSGILSLETPISSEEDNRTLLEQLDSGKDDITELTDTLAAQSEILIFSKQLEEFDISMSDVADNCPKQNRTMAACLKALEYAKSHPELLELLVRTHKLPISQLASGSGVEKKTLERHRKYIVAILLAYTNGYEIIRGHLHQIPRKGERSL